MEQCPIVPPAFLRLQPFKDYNIFLFSPTTLIHFCSSIVPTTMTINPVDQPLQAFRGRSTGEISNIPALTDPKTGAYIVLWRDIKAAFKNAESIWNGKSMVTFLTDENLEQITPLRITYYPGAELEVVTNDEVHVYHAGPPAAASTTTLIADGESEHIGPKHAYNQLSRPSFQSVRSSQASFMQPVGHSPAGTSGNKDFQEQSVHKLRVLSLEPEFPSQDKVKSLNNLLTFYPGLAILHVKLQRYESIGKAISNILDKLGKLESLKVDSGTLSVTADVVKRKVQNVILAVDRLDSFSPNDLNFIQKEGVTKLAIRCSPQHWDEDRLSKIFHTSEFIRMRTMHAGGHTLAVAATLGWNVQDLVEMASSANPKLESLSIRYNKLTLTAEYSLGTIWDMVTTLERLSDLSANDLAFIHQGNITRLVISDVPREEDRDRLIEILRHNPGLTHIQIEHKEQPQDGIVGIPMKLQHLAKLATHDALPKLESLKIDVKDVSFTGNILLREVDLTIKRLSGLDSTVLKFFQGDQLTRLTIRQTPLRNDEHQLTDILSKFPSLSHLVIGCEGTMVTTPSRVTTSPVLARHPLQSIVDEPSTHSRVKPTVPWKPTKKLTLRRLSLRPDDWRALMRGIDFTAVESLDFRWSNISQDPFKLLFNRIALSNASNLPLKILDIRGTEIVEKTNYKTLETMLAELKKKAPGLKVEFIT
ncbi:MAG: hypothetical protein J3Q66DRAFT_426141 [Benniella sp.]|nr:MAG: hypothetical protein J3Q66DRAFT_426141 [Benniella sp.]